MKLLKGDEKNLISVFSAEFKDKTTEKEYLKSDTYSSIEHAKPIILILGAVFLLFSILDYFQLKNSGNFIVFLSFRVIFVLISVLFYLRLKLSDLGDTYGYLVTAYETVGVFILFLIYQGYTLQDFLTQVLGISVIILAVFLIPNRWMNMLIVAILTGTAFLYFMVRMQHNLSGYSIYVSAVYFVVIIALGGFKSYSTNYLNRIRFLNETRLKKLSITDPLTGAFNRLKFNEDLEMYINLSKRYSLELSLVLFDLDNFKGINDRFGHLTGDSVLKTTTRIVMESIRETDTLARWGGEEFVILLPYTGKDHAIQLTQRLKEKISGFMFKPIDEITCSFGVTTLKPDDDAESLMQRVDKLMYMAKKNGKNQIAC